MRLYNKKHRNTIIEQPFFYPSQLIYLLLIAICILYVDPAWASKTAKEKYFSAEKAYLKLQKNKTKQKYRENWLKCIQKFHEAYEHNPNGPWASAGLFKEAVLYSELYKISYKKSDKQKAIDLFTQIKKRYPKSRYRMESIKYLKKMGISESVRRPGKIKVKRPLVTINKPPKITSTDVPPKESQDPYCNTGSTNDIGDEPINKNSKSTITGLRFWSNVNYTRVVIDASQSTRYYHRMLKKDPSINKPQRLFIELNNSIIGNSLQKKIPINDHLLKDARAAQYNAESVRVVIDIKSYKNYKVFSLRNPFRIVIDVWGDSDSTGIANNSSPPVHLPKSQKLKPGSLAKQFALGVKTIVIDPGHGGKDYGAKGYYKGVHEKYVVLEIAKKLAELIRKELSCEVILTRTDDRYITLEERTAIANTQNADLFISIHTNAHTNRNAYGIETYFLNLATDDAAVSVAARENATSTKNISDLQSILDSLMQNAKINESSRLAGFVQNSISKSLSKNYSHIKNKGVKQAPFYVLLGAQMPAVLIESSFISNPRECKRLRNANFQLYFCRSIVEGIKKYIQTTNPTAFRKNQNPITKT